MTRAAPAPAGEGSRRRSGAVAPALLVAVLVLALTGPDWIGLAPNRLLPGEGISGIAALGPGVALVGVLALAGLAAGLTESRVLLRLSAVLFLALAASLPMLSGWAAAPLLAGRPPAARVWLGAGFWIGLGASVTLALLAARRTGWPLAPPVVLGAILAAVIAGYVTGALDALSLVVELRTRGDLLGPALARHGELAAGALALALALAVPLGAWGFRSPAVARVTTAALQGLQVVPAIALLAALVPILSRILDALPGLRAWGIAAIGPAPAVLGVGAYLTLPLVSSILAALRATDPALVEAARGLGLDEGRITREVRIPLGMPILASALRLATVQSIGLTTLGGLVGAGGLGAVVFEGMAQFAPDLILLGAAPIVAMALVADWGLGAVHERWATSSDEPA